MARNLILGVLVAAAACGCATSSQSSPADTRAAKNSLEATAPVVDPYCARDTGSRIERPDDKACGAEPGRTYTQQELEDTGRLDVGEALRQLDPRIY